MGYKIRVDIDTYKDDYGDLAGVAVSLYEEGNATAIATGTTDSSGSLQLNVDRATAAETSPGMLKVAASKASYSPSSGMAVVAGSEMDGSVMRYDFKIKPVLPGTTEILPPPDTHP